MAATMVLLTACSPTSRDERQRASGERPDFAESSLPDEAYGRRLREGFERCGTVDLSAFEGRYVTRGDVGEGEYFLFQIED